ncbi:hypothetical protein CAPTEDRAFT_215125 [Capitella teleta]|uniref:Uncharacterized protein n=1 Tax=Capitella teleta TaxID=283909 RepID=R7UJS5_CAPTE|nr:hypothetical protein CAPTEDRAFT_215125 [Capitella teleta]|eukprot:ELU06460.1 hypothetical protein CAPTEDRAFT_215125 [Capitella teleta]
MEEEAEVERNQLGPDIPKSEILQAIQDLKTDKAESEDGIPPEMFKAKMFKSLKKALASRAVNSPRITDRDVLRFPYHGKIASRNARAFGNGDTVQHAEPYPNSELADFIIECGPHCLVLYLNGLALIV